MKCAYCNDEITGTGWPIGETRFCSRDHMQRWTVMNWPCVIAYQAHFGPVGIETGERVSVRFFGTKHGQEWFTSDDLDKLEDLCDAFVAGVRFKP